MRTQHLPPALRSLPAMACALSLLLVSLAPSALATYRAFGEPVDGKDSDKDITHLLLVTLAVAPGAEVAFADTGDGAPQTSEGVYIDADGSGTITALDIRLRPSTGTSGTKGEQVKTTDSDCCGTALTAALGSWTTVDVYPALVSGACQDVACPDGAVNLGDPIFLDLDGNGVLGVLDMKITSRGTSAAGGVPTTSGSASLANVASSDADFGAALTTIAGYALNVFDADGDGTYGFGDAVYLDLDGDQRPEPGDVRLNKAGNLQAGTMPKAGDTDTVHQLTAFGAPGGFLAFVDATPNGVVGATEGLYLDLDSSGTVSIGDVRFLSTGTSSGSAGKQMVSTDTSGDALGTALTTLPGNGFMFNDRNGNTIFDSGDDLYLEMDGDAVVEPGDFRVTKGTGSSNSPGSRVAASSSDLSQPLTALGAGPVLAYFDFNGGGAYNRNDVVYLDVDADGLITARDVRLMAGQSPMNTFGEVITDAETEFEYCFDALSGFGGGAFRYVEQTGAGVLNLEEPIYFDRTGSGAVKVHDVRMDANGAGSAGSFVASGANDQSNPLTAMPGTFVGAPSFFDANGDTVYSMQGNGNTDDTVYLDIDGSGTITAGDLRVTKAHTGSGSAGTRVSGSAPVGEINGALTAFAGGAFAAIDSNGDGTFSSKDALYYNVDAALDTVIFAAGCATPGDVRMSGTSSSGGGGGGGGSGGSGGSASVPASIAIQNPAQDAYVKAGQQFTISGTAGAGSTSGSPNTIASVVLTVNQEQIPVTGTTSWSAVYTPGAVGDYTIRVTVTPSSGNPVSVNRIFHANVDGTAPATQPPPPPASEPLQQQLTVLLGQNAQLASQINTTLSQNQALSSQISTLNSQLSDQTGQLTSLNARLAELRAENSRLQAQLRAQGSGGNGTGADGKDTPGFEPLLLLAGLGVAMLAARRRR